MDKMSPDRQITRRDFLRTAATAVAGGLVACTSGAQAATRGTEATGTPPVPTAT